MKYVNLIFQTGEEQRGLVEKLQETGKYVYVNGILKPEETKEFDWWQSKDIFPGQHVFTSSMVNKKLKLNEV